MKTRLVFLFLVLAGLASAQPVWPPDTFSCYYGEITPEAVKQLKDIDLLIVHPGKDLDNLDRQKIEALRRSGPGKTIVAYVSVGEDDEIPGGPPIKGQDISGPSFVDASLEVKEAGNGYPLQFLDQMALEFDEDGFLKFGPDGKPIVRKGQDGHPDENGVWGSFYVRTDVEAWQKQVFAVMDQMAELGVDGFFLDTVDTASPWGDYGWTSAAMLDFVGKIRQRYPDKRIVANRGLFYLSQNDRYANLIDAVLFESLLTHYNWAADIGEVSPWAKWHVKALDEEVIPSVGRSDMHLLVLDYLNPKQSDALALVQSDVTLLQDTPHALSFSHPNLQVVGWTPKDLLPEAQPPDWPVLNKIEMEETGEPGDYTMTATFGGPIPKGAHPDLRVTRREDVKADRAAGLAPAQIVDWDIQGDKLVVHGTGLDKNQKYTVFLRLISRAFAPQTSFGWTSYTSRNSERPAQVEIQSESSRPEGVQLIFKADSLVARSYRVYSVDGEERTLLKEVSESPALLENLEVGKTYHITVSAVTADGQEGYASKHFPVVRQDVVAPPPPGEVSVEQEGVETRFSWQPGEGAESYRLYVVPSDQSFRLPLLVNDLEKVVEDVVPGEYKVFLTSGDDNGNQSRRGPIRVVTIK